MKSQRLIGRLLESGSNARTKHYFGLPPSLTDGRDERSEMKPAALLVIEEKADGIFLYRYASDGSYAGDTWHMNIEEAKQQAAFEFAGVSIHWNDVPGDVEDVVTFGMAQVRSDKL